MPSTRLASNTRNWLTQSVSGSAISLTSIFLRSGGTLFSHRSRSHTGTNGAIPASTILLIHAGSGSVTFVTSILALSRSLNGYSSSSHVGTHARVAASVTG